MAKMKKKSRPVSSILPNYSEYGKPTRSSAVHRDESWLPKAYEGPRDRIQRYKIYNVMDHDNEVKYALDTLADFSTRDDELTGLPFVVKYSEDIRSHEISIVEESLKSWVKLNEFGRRTWDIFRSTLKYGDQIYIRDPETYVLYWVDIANVSKIWYDESNNNQILFYTIKGINVNLSMKVATTVNPQTNVDTSGLNSAYIRNSSSGIVENEVHVAAEHVLHLGLSDNGNANWPFSESVLDYVYKPYKQKQLLEDAVIIYRVHRAPERRVFKVHTGDMRPDQAQTYLHKFKNSVIQKRIPARDDKGNVISDSIANPMSMLEDFFFSVGTDGIGSSVDVLPGGASVADIDDLRFFDNKLIRALGIPSSYLPTGPMDATGGFNDGRVGTAFIQEFRFSMVCERYQKLIMPALQREFKNYVKQLGFNIDSSLFDIYLTKPQSFSNYRQLELDAAHINVFSAMNEVPYLSKRFILERYLGLTKEEIIRNEKLKLEEKGTNNEVPEDDNTDDPNAKIPFAKSEVDGMYPDEASEVSDEINTDDNENLDNDETDVEEV